MKKTKKIVLMGSLVGIILFFILGFGTPIVCSSNYRCQDSVESIFPYLMILFPLLLLSLIAYKLREETFHTWLHFAYGFVPFSIFLTFLARNSSGGSTGIPNILDQETVAFLLSVLFFVISLILIIYKSIKLRARPERIERGK